MNDVRAVCSVLRMKVYIEYAREPMYVPSLAAINRLCSFKHIIGFNLNTIPSAIYTGSAEYERSVRFLLRYQTIFP